jgi:hypothetical protein
MVRQKRLLRSRIVVKNFFRFMQHWAPETVRLLRFLLSSSDLLEVEIAQIHVAVR